MVYYASQVRDPALLRRMHEVLLDPFSIMRKTCGSPGFIFYARAGKKALCLYGHADGSWELRRPDELAPSHMPEPMLGVNFRPDYMSPFAWLEFIAQRADSWLFGVAFFFAACLNANQRYILPNNYSVRISFQVEGCIQQFFFMRM